MFTYLVIIEDLLGKSCFAKSTHTNYGIDAEIFTVTSIFQQKLHNFLSILVSATEYGFGNYWASLTPIIIIIIHCLLLRDTYTQFKCEPFFMNVVKYLGDVFHLLSNTKAKENVLRMETG
ncbi:hypothetical protein V8G54_013962 [Vigna mungo]|uniref:Uncharacterized protein n=1 Tax=Vigna mungo TaxID=3915 RepID=A0AAQ3NGT4_VIGMU